jgi:cytoskeletal protein CcmA (bactofilin family)
MWRKQDEPKPSPPTPDVVVPTPVPPQSSEPQARESRATGGSVSEAISIKGEISGREDLYVDGEVQGSIHLTDGTVTIGPQGRVTADIEAREILVRGKVTGNLHGRERVQIARTGQATGDIATRRIAIEEGAIFRGRIDVVRGEEARQARSAERATGTADVRPISIRSRDEQL